MAKDINKIEPITKKKGVAYEDAPWTAVYQASLSFTISWSLLKLMSAESMMPSY